MLIQTNFSSGFVLPCTNRCLVKFHDELISCLNEDKKNCLSTRDYNLLLGAEKLLKMPVYDPELKSSQKIIKIGSGAEIVIDKQSPVIILMDGAFVLKNDFLLQNQELITVGSSLGSAILNKGKGETGKFKVNGKIHNFEILRVLPYKEIKSLFFPKITMN